MTGFLTPEEARGYDCPTARIHGDGKSGKCRADHCILWRWLPLPAEHPLFQSAVKRECACLAQAEAEKSGKPAKNSDHYLKKAVANVAKNPAGFGVPDHDTGWCGLGSKPE